MDESISLNLIYCAWSWWWWCWYSAVSAHMDQKHEYAKKQSENRYKSETSHFSKICNNVNYKTGSLCGDKN
jgi:hypothetical protein